MAHARYQHHNAALAQEERTQNFDEWPQPRGISLAAIRSGKSLNALVEEQLRAAVTGNKPIEAAKVETEAESRPAPKTSRRRKVAIPHEYKSES